MTSEEVLESLKGVSRGRLHLAVTSTVNDFAPRLLAVFQRRYPGIGLELDVTNREQLVRMLCDNAVDLVLMGVPPTDVDVESQSFMENPLVVIAPAGLFPGTHCAVVPAPLGTASSPQRRRRRKQAGCCRTLALDAALKIAKTRVFEPWSPSQRPWARGASELIMSLSILLRTLILTALCASSAVAIGASPDPLAVETPDWVITDTNGEARVPLYVFWSKTCPHCQTALGFLDTLREQEPWIQVNAFELAADRAHVARYVAMAAALGEEARSVPAFFVCGRMVAGFDDADGVGAQLLGLARFCRQTAAPQAMAEGAAVSAPDPQIPIRLPVFGALDPAALSLPIFTLVIAGLDAFNPCAFFVLFFLLSLMVHARSRARMLLIGGTFVVFSGVVYFLFMAAWLNLFLVIGGAAVVTTVAGLVALLVGGLNVKDYFFFGQGPSLSIPAQAKPGLFARMRALLSADRIGAMLVGTLVLALAANSYELLCTAGFPMVYTRTLTLHDLSMPAYYGYLALYNLIYILPLLAIVLLFTFTLGAKKLSERQGRILKLISGLMMLGLGAVMLIGPEWLVHPWVGALLLLLAGSLTALIAVFERPRRQAPPA